MGFTNVYWQPEAYAHFPERSYLFPITRHLNMDWEIPAHEPVTAGWYFSENPVIPNVHDKISLNPRPEYFAVGGEVVTRGGRVALSKEEQKYKRKFYIDNKFKSFIHSKVTLE